MSIWRVALRGATSNIGRFGLTISAVVLSVMFITATLVVVDSVNGTAETDIASANDGLDLVIEGRQVATGDSGPGQAALATRTGLNRSDLETARTIDGVANLAAVTTGFAKLLDDDGEAIGVDTDRDIGQNWITDPDLNSFTITDGRPPQAADEVALDARAAEDAEVALGDKITVLTPAGASDFTIVGKATYGSADTAPLQRSTLFSPDSTAATLGVDTLSEIRISTEPTAEPARVAADLRQALPDTEVSTGEEFIATRQGDAASPFTFLSVFLMAFTAIAAVVGATVIYNTFTIAMAQRQRELALMRAIGAHRRQVLSAVLGEATAIAILASAIGVAVGVFAARLLRSVMSAVGLTFLSGPIVIEPSTLAIAGVLGVAVTIASAFAPARRASKVHPIAALRDSTVEPRADSRSRALIGAACIAAGVAGLIVAAATTSALPLIAAILLLPGLILAGPSLITVTARRARPTLARLAAVEGDLAAINLTRNSRRSASTSLGLTLGVALVGFFVILAATLASGLGSSLSSEVRADYVVASSGFQIATVQPDLADTIRTQPGIDDVVSYTIAEGAVDETSTLIAGIDPGADAVYNFAVTEGSLDELGPGRIAVAAPGSTDTAGDHKLGDIVDVDLVDGSIQAEVVAIFDQALPGFDPPSYVLDTTTLNALRKGLLTDAIFVSTTSPAAEDDLADIIAASPGAQLETPEQYAAGATDGINELRNMILAMLALTLIIAIVGVANTTALSISERVRETGLLRAIGTQQSGVQRIFTFEAALLSSIGTLVGAVIAIAGSWAFVAAIGGDQLPSPTYPATPLTILIAGALAAGIASAILPARRASRVPTLEAIAS